jgi:hypothetical protein
MSPSRTWYSAALYFIIIVTVLAAKPKFAFNEDGTMKDFGTGENRSVFNFGVLTGTSAVLSGMIFAVADLVAVPLETA